MHKLAKEVRDLKTMAFGFMVKKSSPIKASEVSDGYKNVLYPPFSQILKKLENSHPH